jgi:hypothetical protein
MLSFTLSTRLMSLPTDARKIPAAELRKAAESADGRREQDLTAGR